MFCEENYLIPNKMEHDFGFDFLCQIDMAKSLAQLGQISGAIVGFSVRSTIKASGKIKVTRADAECLLAAKFPVGLALVKVNEEGPGEVFFRLLDEEFTVELCSFLASKKGVKHFVPGDLLPGVEIQEEMKRASASGFVERSRLIAAEKFAAPIVGDVHIQIRRDSDGHTTLVTALDLYKYFEQRNDSDRRALHLATFGVPRLRNKRLRSLALKEGLMGGLARLPQPYVLAGFVMDEPSPTRVGGPTATADLLLFRTGNEHHFGYVHEAGFALTISRRKKQDGQYVHEMHALVDEESDSDWADHLDLLKFLDACRPDSEFTFRGDREIVLEAAYFEGLGKCSNFASALLQSRFLTGFENVPVIVRDMTLEESRATMSWLAAAAMPDSHVIPRKLMTMNVEEGDCEARDALIEVPVVCNLAEASVVVWFSGKGSVFFYEGEPCGFKVRAYESREVEVWEKFAKNSTFPEISLGIATLTIQNGVFAVASENALYGHDIHLAWRLED
ncbi:hypothetical protein [Planomonospora sphaerica]|nr:hypothetical protein [Planomonospora sphaerica]